MHAAHDGRDNSNKFLKPDSGCSMRDADRQDVSSLIYFQWQKQDVGPVEDEKRRLVSLQEHCASIFSDDPLPKHPCANAECGLTTPLS